MIRAIQRSCSAAKPTSLPAQIVRAIGYAPFVPPVKMPVWSRSATFIPSHMRVPISIGGRWNASPRRSFGNEEDAGVRFTEDGIVKLKEITVDRLKGTDWNGKADLLLDLRRGNYHVIDFPKGSLAGEAGWAEEMLRTVSQGKKLNFYARSEKGAGESVHKNPGVEKMKELEIDFDGRELVVHSLDVSKEIVRKAAADLLAAVSAKASIRLTFY